MRKKILVVDNNAVFLRLMFNLLEEQGGYLVKSAADGLAALELLQEFIPDVIFLDLIMPKISGDKLSRIIRDSPSLRHVRIVILSCFTAGENFNYLDFGADACIAKGPFKKTSQHILDVLSRLDTLREQDQAPTIYGLDEIFPRQETDELLSCNRHFKTILANISDGILECTVDAKIVYANPLAATFLQQAEETALLSTSLLDHFRLEDRDRVARVLRISSEAPQVIGEDDPLRLYERLISLTCIEVVEQQQRFLLILIRDLTTLKRIEDERLHGTRIQTAINDLLQFSLDGLGLAEVLEEFLGKITSLPWLNLEPAGAVFLNCHNSRTMMLRAHRSLPSSVVDPCQLVPLGHCLCGRSAERGEVVFADEHEAREVHCLTGQEPLNRYCVPIPCGGQRLLGVFTVILKAGFPWDRRVEETLVAAANVLSSIIDKNVAAQQLRESEEGYRAFAKIGLALSREKDIDRLLEMIVNVARNRSQADAGTLYLIDKEARHLSFAVLQNDTMKTRLRGSDPGTSFPCVPLYIDGRPNHENVASYVALTDQIVNIPDVYEAEGFNFTGPRKYDAATGYRSRSMLVIPLKNHVDEIIGVLQLLNAQHRDTGEIIAFSDKHVDLIASLASQAAIALTNIQLVKDQKFLFYAFIQSIATAIDQKSPYTGGHVRRVYDLTMMIADKINETEQEPFGQVCFNEDELEELRLAAWMHDVGKITTPDHVVNKADKLETIFSRIKLVETRFGLIAQVTEKEVLRQKLALLETGEVSSEAMVALDTELAVRLQMLRDDLAFIVECNKTSEFMKDEKIARILSIASRTYVVNGEEHPFLDEDEVENLCVRKGNLNVRERKIIENHVTMTQVILKHLPFPKNLAKVPDYASGHHEKLDGSGYPLGLAGESLPLQMRIMAIADIFEALTAKDRPYREPMPLSQAIKILESMKKDRHIDSAIFDLFLASGLYRLYAEKEMDPEQIDV